METTPEPAAPSTEELADLEAEFARLEAELTSLDDAGDGEQPPDAAEEAGA